MRYFYAILLFCFITELNAVNTQPPVFYNDSIYELGMYSRPRPKFRKQLYAFNTLFVEGCFVYGYYNAQKFSINYDIVAQKAENTALALRIGYEKVQMGSGTDRVHIPMFANFLLGRKNFLEGGFGAFWDLTNQKINPAFVIAFRHQPPKGGFFFRLHVFLTNEKEIDEVTKLELKRIWVYGPGAALGWSF